MKRSELASLSCGFALVLFGVFVALSLLSWDARDPQALSNYEGAHVRIHNRCGAGGAHVASFLFRNHGLAAYCVPVALAGVGACFIRRGSMKDGSRRLTGAAVLVVAASLLAGTLSSGWLGAAMATRSVHGPGGAFGAQPVAAMARMLGGVGTQLVILFVAGAGALLASREVVERVLGRLGRLCLEAGPFVTHVARVSIGRFPRTFTRRTTQEVLTSLPPLAQKMRAATSAMPKVSVVSEVKSAATSRPQTAPATPPFVADAHASAKPRGNQTIADVTTRRLKPKSTAHRRDGFELPPVEMLIKDDARSEVNKDELAQRGVQIVSTFSEFGIDTHLVGYEPGPAVTMYEFELAPGIKVNKVIGLADNLAMAVMSPNVRVIAPLPGKATIGVEVPNLRTDVVRMRPILEGPDLESEPRAIPLIFGRDAGGRPLIADLATMPHLLVAGASGSGKSVCMHSIITSILMLKRPDEVRLVLVDPKMVEFTRYRGIAHLASPVVTEVKRASGVLDWAVREMQARYELLSTVGARDIGSYNKLTGKERVKLAGEGQSTRRFHKPIPYIVIMVDELSDLMMVASKEVENTITRLAQKSRATGIHLVLATQRPSVDVVTGLIKSNISCRIAFHVTARIDSSVILDRPGAEKLLGQGDMLFLAPGYSAAIRAKGVYLSDDEIGRVVEHVRLQQPPEAVVSLVRSDGDEPSAADDVLEADGGPDDALYEDAVRIVLGSQRGSVSLLQRRLGIGFTRAGKLIDQMATEGILGPYRGSKSRDIITTLERWEAQRGEVRQKSA